MSGRNKRIDADVNKQGDAAAMREALELVNKIYDLLSKPCIVIEEVRQVCQKARAVLIAPPLRNCDVGTAEEQRKRQHDTMCNTTKACPDSDWSCRKCFSEWAQMPYEEGERT